MSKLRILLTLFFCTSILTGTAQFVVKTASKGNKKSQKTNVQTGEKKAFIKTSSNEQSGPEFTINNQEGIPIHYYILSATDKTVAVCGGKKAYDGIESLVIPEKISYQGVDYVVREIAPKAFGSITWGGCGIKRVVFPSTLKSIGEQAFALCGYLNEIILPEGLLVIGKKAFLQATPDVISIPSSVKRMEKAFGYNINIATFKPIKTDIINLPSFITKYH